MAWIGAAATIGGALLSNAGQSSANAAAAGQTRKQRRWSEKMSSTAYQRAVGDLRAAGLNPMLAYTQGGATTPGTSAPPVLNEAEGFQNVGAGIMSSLQTAANVKKTAAEIDNIKADTAVKKVQPDNVVAQTRAAIASAGQMDSFRNKTEQDIKFFLDTWEDQKRKVAGEAKSSHYRGENESIKYNVDIATQSDRIRKIREEANELAFRARVAGLRVPEALNEAAFESSDLGRESRNIDFTTKQIERVGSKVFDLLDFKKGKKK